MMGVVFLVPFLGFLGSLRLKFLVPITIHHVDSISNMVVEV